MRPDLQGNTWNLFCSMFCVGKWIKFLVVSQIFHLIYKMKAEIENIRTLKLKISAMNQAITLETLNVLEINVICCAILWPEK
jgi:hypothetical protein